MTAAPDHTAALTEQVLDILGRRAHWQTAKSTEDVAPHAYCCKGWDKDDLTEQDFWLVVDAIKTFGREEVWTPPEE
jgi:hypothetical protein